jgi:enterochelin esterase family protein
MYLSLMTSSMTIEEREITINSASLNRKVTCTLLIPQEYNLAEPLNLLLFNDGQETEKLGFKKTIENLYSANCIKPVLTAAIHAGEARLQEYGTANQPDYQNRGALAADYTSFVLNELLPAILAETGKTFGSVAFAGFSLGGLSAFDIAWNNPDVFDKVGVFSASFWWRSKGLEDNYTNNDRIMHSIIRSTETKPDLKFWLQTGTDDETADRNQNGIIDSLDDTTDLIYELEQKGYTRPADIQYLEMLGGQHNTSTWAKALPKFLIWAFGK